MLVTNIGVDCWDDDGRLLIAVKEFVHIRILHAHKKLLKVLIFRSKKKFKKIEFLTKNSKKSKSFLKLSKLTSYD